MNAFHNDTQELIQLLRRSTPQSVLLSGALGIGIESVALSVASGSEVTSISPDDTKASKPITTESIRTLYDLTRSKSRTKRYVIIHSAEAMTHAAQGAFLKLLEEPNDAVHFILLSSKPDVLLPTIHSRLQHHVIKPLTRQQSEGYLDTLGVYDSMMRQQLLYIAEGLPEELTRLAKDESYFKKSVEIVKDARNILQASLYDKILVVNNYKDDRNASIDLLAFALTITRRSLSQHPQGSLIAQLNKLLVADEQLKENGNVRITLTQLVL
jgi:DNA polymerase III delta prime subunit